MAIWLVILAISVWILVMAFWIQHVEARLTRLDHWMERVTRKQAQDDE
jgi:hypothetical protein